MRIDRTRKHQGKTGSDRNWHLNTASPRHILTQRFEAGLRAHEIWRVAFPSCLAQWHCDAPTLAYRCGGSTGIEKHLFPDYPKLKMTARAPETVSPAVLAARQSGNSTPGRLGRTCCKGTSLPIADVARQYRRQVQQNQGRGPCEPRSLDIKSHSKNSVRC